MTEDPLIASRSSQPSGPRAYWPLLPCLLVGLAGALVPFAGLTGLGAPSWLALTAGLAVFPVLPALWHAFAERARQAAPGQGSRRSLPRFALRTLALGLLVIAVALAALGPRGLAEGVGRAMGIRKPEWLSRQSGSPAPTPSLGPALAPAHHELESFIPADATLVIALSDPAAIKRLVGANEGEIQKTWAALAKCQIQVDRARILITARDSTSRMIVVRAPGVTDQRNLYCLVGVLGNNRVKLQAGDTAGDKNLRLEIDALFSKPLQFEVADSQTIVAIDAGWKGSAGRKLDPAQAGTGPGRTLASALDRIDRRAGLWSVGIAETDKGWWDLAVEARFDGNDLLVRASSTPPAGAASRTTVDAHMPAGFLSALPQAALTDGVRGVLGLVMAAGAGVSPSAKHAPPAAQPGGP